MRPVLPVWGAAQRLGQEVEALGIDTVQLKCLTVYALAFLEALTGYKTTNPPNNSWGCFKTLQRLNGADAVSELEWRDRLLPVSSQIYQSVFSALSHSCGVVQSSACIMQLFPWLHYIPT